MVTSGQVASIGPQPALGRLPADLGRHAVGRIEKVGPFGHLGKIVDENHPQPTEPVHHPFVVDDLVVDVDRRAETPDRQLQALDRHVDPGAEPAGAGKDHSHRGRGRGSGISGQGSRH